MALTFSPRDQQCGGYSIESPGLGIKIVLHNSCFEGLPPVIVLTNLRPSS